MFPGLAIFLAVLSFNLVSHGPRDALESATAEAHRGVISFGVMLDAVEEFHPVLRQTVRAGTLAQQRDVAG